MATHRILGISIGTTKIGIAVLQRNEIYEWKMKGFDESWSPDKLEAIIAYIDDYTLVHPLKSIGVKIPALHSHTSAITQIIQRIEHLAKIKGIILQTYTLSDIKLHWNGQQKATRDQLTQTILGKHPKFQSHYNRMKRTKTVHFEKLFEAIAVAHMVR